MALLLTACVGCTAVNRVAQTTVLPDPQAQRKQEVARQFDQKRDQAEFEAAWSAWQRGDMAVARQSLEALLQRNPQHCDALLLMIDVCLAANRIEEALQHARAARTAFPQDARVHYAAATVLDYANRRQEALDCYQQAARLAPDNEVYAVAYHSAREALLAGPSFSAAPGVASAVSQGTSTVTTRYLANSKPCDCNDSGDGDDVEGLVRRAEDALRAEQPELAFALFREAAAHKPNDSQLILHGATAALRHNHPDLAVELLEPVARSSNCATLYCTLAVARYRLGDYRASEVALRQALSLDKSSALAYFLMGCTLRKLGQSEQAEAHFRQAALLDPRYAQTQ